MRTLSSRRGVWASDVFKLRRSVLRWDNCKRQFVKGVEHDARFHQFDLQVVVDIAATRSYRRQEAAGVPADDWDDSCGKSQELSTMFSA